jgi:sugar fermentation stimulation protein A
LVYYSFPPLSKGILLKRYKRFFVDIKTQDSVITAHNPNTGSMRSLMGDGREALYSVSSNPKRKLKYTLELINVNGEWITSNTTRANEIAQTALLGGVLPDLYTKGSIQREFTFQNSRFDFLLPGNTIVEVKSVTYFNDSVAMFPDAKTERGRKHLYTLMKAVKQDYRAVMLYILMSERKCFTCAKDIDEKYCAAMEEAVNSGVEIRLLTCRYDYLENRLHIYCN